MTHAECFDRVVQSMDAALSSPMASVEIHRACVTRGITSDPATLMQAVKVLVESRHWMIQVALHGMLLFETTPFEFGAPLKRAQADLETRFPAAEGWSVIPWEVVVAKGARQFHALNSTTWERLFGWPERSDTSANP